MMVQVKKFSTRWMRNEEHYGFMLSMVEQVKTLANEKMASMVQEFCAAVEEEAAALQMPEGSDLTEQITVLDSERDRSWRSFRLYLKAAALSLDPTMVQAAKALIRLFERYGDPRRLPYLQANGVYVKLLDELADEPYRSHVATLHLEHAQEAMQSRQTAFFNLYMERNARQAALGQSRVKEMRVAVDLLWRDICQYANALQRFEGSSESLEHFIRTVNEHIDDQCIVRAARATVRARKRKAAADVAASVEPDDATGSSASADDYALRTTSASSAAALAPGWPSLLPTEQFVPNVEGASDCSVPHEIMLENGTSTRSGSTDSLANPGASHEIELHTTAGDGS